MPIKFASDAPTHLRENKTIDKMNKVTEKLIDLRFKTERPTLQIKCSLIRRQEYSINLLQLIEPIEMPILLTFEHEQQQTMIDGTGIDNYLMASFDQENELIGVSFFNQIGTGTYRVLSQAKSVLIFPKDQFAFNVAEIWKFVMV